MDNTKGILLFIFFFGCVLPVISQETSQKSIALINATIIDVENSQLIANTTIVLENGQIKAIKPSDSSDLENIRNTVNLEGKYIIPGLIDSHVHLFRPTNRKEILTMLLHSGVTSVRDMGGDARMYQSLNEEIQGNKLIGPDIYYSANVFGPTFLKDPRTKFAAMGYEPGTAPWMRLVTDTSNLENLVIEAKKAGVTGLKVYSNVKPALLAKISRIAHNNGLKMWSHSSVFPSKPSDAVAANVDVLSHSIGMIFEKESNMPESFNEAILSSVPLQDFDNTDVLDPIFAALFDKLKSTNTIFEPTLSAWSEVSNSKPAEIGNLNGNPNPTAHLATAANQMNRASLNDWSMRITNAAFEHGVTIAAGTDFNIDIKWVQDEIILLTKAGLTNMEALKAATLTNAKVIGIEHMVGSISEGKIANLVVLEKNPLEKIENIRTVVAVYKNGIAYKITK